jgi:hypothetical protein
MSASEEQGPSARRRWRGSVAGAVAGVVVAAAIVVPSAIASSGQSGAACAGGKGARALVAPGAAAGKPAPPPPGSVPHQFLDAVAQLQQDGTISAAQARTVDAAIESGRIDLQKMVAGHVLTAAQMKAVNDRLVAVKTGLANQAQASGSQSGSAAHSTAGG